MNPVTNPTSTLHQPNQHRIEQQQQQHLQEQSELQQLQPQQNKGQFRQQTLQQYYRYLNLLKRTHNFCKDFNVYKNLNDHDFEDLAVIGWIFEVENLKIKTEDGKEQQCLMPVVYSNMKEPFRNHQENPTKPYSSNQSSSSQPVEPQKRFAQQKSLTSSVCNTTDQPIKPQPLLQPHIRRPLLLLKSLYTKYFIKAFNQIIKESKQFKKFFQIPTTHTQLSQNSPVNGNIFSEIQWIYAFTGLKLAIDNGKMCFMITEKTRIISLDTKFYTEVIENLEKSVGFPYSYLTLNSMPKHYDAESIQQGYPLSALQTQASIIDRIAFTGILKEKFVDQGQTSANQNKKDKEIILTFLQDSIHPGKEMLGLAKVLIKYSIEESEEEIMNFFKIGYVYLVTNASLAISDNISILYKPKQKWQDHIFEINIQKSPDISTKMVREELPFVEMSWMKLANVNRNIVKIRVDLVRCEAFYGKILCTNCRRALNSEGFCTGYCGENEGELILWVVALVSDESTYAQISMQKNETIQFFDLTAEHLQQIRQHILAQNSRRMVRLFDRFLQIQPSTSSQPLLSFQRHIATRFVSKSLIGVPRYNLHQSFTHQLNEQEKVEFQQSLQTSKEYMKKNKVHFNGYVKKIQRTLRLAVPFVKVVDVLGGE